MGEGEQMLGTGGWVLSFVISDSSVKEREPMTDRQESTTKFEVVPSPLILWCP